MGIVDPEAWEYLFGGSTQECDDGVVEEKRTTVTKVGRRKVILSTEEITVIAEALLLAHAEEVFPDRGELSTKYFEQASEQVDVEALLEKMLKLAKIN